MQNVYHARLWEHNIHTKIVRSDCQPVSHRLPSTIDGIMSLRLSQAGKLYLCSSRGAAGAALPQLHRTTSFSSSQLCCAKGLMSAAACMALHAACAASTPYKTALSRTPHAVPLRALGCAGKRKPQHALHAYAAGTVLPQTHHHPVPAHNFIHILCAVC